MEDLAQQGGYKMFKKWDKIILSSVLLCGLLLAVWYFVQGAWGASFDRIIIKVHGETYKIIRIDEIKYGELIEIKTKYGYNMIEMTKEGIRIVDADCFNHTCIHQGAINRPGASLVCVPNYLTVTLAGGNEGVDTVAH
jgi:hypothetical protein